MIGLWKKIIFSPFPIIYHYFWVLWEDYFFCQCILLPKIYSPSKKDKKKLLMGCTPLHKGGWRYREYKLHLAPKNLHPHTHTHKYMHTHTHTLTQVLIIFMRAVNLAHIKFNAFFHWWCGGFFGSIATQ